MVERVFARKLIQPNEAFNFLKINKNKTLIFIFVVIFPRLVIHARMGQSLPLFVYLCPFHNPIPNISSDSTLTKHSF